MKSSKQLKEERGQKLNDQKALLEKRTQEKRDFTEDEVKRFNALDAAIEKLDADIAQREKEEAAEARAARLAGLPVNPGPSGKEVKELRKYSFVKAIRSQVNGQNLEGIEAEMHQEAVKEARKSGIELEGLGVPSMFMDHKKEKRDLVVGTPSAGGETVQTDLGDLIPALRPSLLVEQMGARVLSGLQGDIKLPRNNGVGAAQWEGEQDDANETTPTFDSISLTPHRLSAFTNYSKKLLAQSSLSVESFVREDLEMAIQIAVDGAAINGSDSVNPYQPVGILNISGIGDVNSGNANGDLPTFENMVDLETAVAIDNALMGSLGYLSTPGIRGVLKKTRIDTGSGQFVIGHHNVMAQDSQELNGYRAGFSTQVPSTLEKGSNDDCHAIIFGNFNDLIVANWAGVDIVVDPYTLAKKGSVQVVVNSFWDIALRHPESFAAMKDARLVATS